MMAMKLIMTYPSIVIMRIEDLIEPPDLPPLEEEPMEVDPDFEGPHEEPACCLAFRLESSSSESIATIDLDPEISRWEFLYGDAWDERGIRQNRSDSEVDSESLPSLVTIGSSDSGEELPSQPPFRILPDDDTFKEPNFVGFMPVPRHEKGLIKPRAFIPMELPNRSVSVSKPGAKFTFKSPFPVPEPKARQSRPVTRVTRSAAAHRALSESAVSTVSSSSLERPEPEKGWVRRRPPASLLSKSRWISVRKR